MAEERKVVTVLFADCSEAPGMHARMDGLNARIEPGHGVRLSLRIGVNTGELLVSDDPDADLGTVTGDAVNVRARQLTNATTSSIDGR